MNSRKFEHGDCICFLGAKLADYFYQAICYLSEHENIQVYIVAYQKNPDAPFNFEEKPLVKVINRNTFKEANALEKWLREINPRLIYCAGWFDKAYLMAIKNISGVPKIMGLDNIWIGSLRQRLGVFYFKWQLRKIFSHVWIAGTPQYSFARKLGFSDSAIIFGLYTANTNLFHQAFQSWQRKKGEYSKTLLYIGRYVAYKKPLMLAEVFAEIFRADEHNGWTIKFIGSGELYDQLIEFQSDGIEISGFVSPCQLPEILSNAGAFCLPSKNEHWGVVIHEAAASGLPLVLSDTCGASSQFLVSDKNGWLFETNNKIELRKTLLKLFNSSSQELIEMSNNSYKLSFQLNHEIWSATLIGTLIE